MVIIIARTRVARRPRPARVGVVELAAQAHQLAEPVLAGAGYRRRVFVVPRGVLVGVVVALEEVVDRAQAGHGGFGEQGQVVHHRASR